MHDDTGTFLIDTIFAAKSGKNIRKEAAAGYEI